MCPLLDALREAQASAGFHVFGYGNALFLRGGGKNGQQEFRIAVSGVDMLFLGVYAEFSIV